MNEEILNFRKKYYSKVYVKYELIKIMKYKETVFMSISNNRNCIRGINIYYLKLLEDNFKAFKFFNKDYNIYISCANYEKIPFFTFNLSERSSETSVWFKERAYKDLIGYDILLDFDYDNKNYKDYLNEVIFIYNLLYKNDICFYIIPSSRNNYQIIIPSNSYWLDKYKNKLTKNNKKIIFVYDFIRKFKERFNLKYLDVSGVGFSDKIMKCPYSLVIDFIVFPFQLGGLFKELNNFRLLNLKRNYSIIYNRGLMLHNDNKDVKINNFYRFLDRYYV